jgi:hypothetical protein
LQVGDSEKWIEFVPEDNQFDLVQLPGDITEQLWRGDIPEGQYIKARLYISSVTGTLKSDGSTLEIMVPSNKLELNLPAFDVSADSVTSFTYDITVVKAGNAQSGLKYLLKPQASESGVEKEPKPARDKTNDKKIPDVAVNSTPTPVKNNKTSGKKTPDATDSEADTPTPVDKNKEKK